MALSMHVFGLRAAFLGDLSICLPLNVNAQRYIEDIQITSHAPFVMGVSCLKYESYHYLR